MIRPVTAVTGSRLQASWIDQRLSWWRRELTNDAFALGVCLASVYLLPAGEFQSSPCDHCLTAGKSNLAPGPTTALPKAIATHHSGETECR